MNIHQEFIPRVKVEEPGKDDRTLSYTGTKDFTKAEPELKTFGPRLPNPRPRSKVSQNNSYT